MMNQDDDNSFPFPIPISPGMPLSQQLSMNSLNPGMQPNNSPNYNFNPNYTANTYSYKKGGHIFKKYRKVMGKTGLGKILPAAGALVGNYFFPGVGGVVGGGVGGALSGSKKPLKSAGIGAGIGALQGFGLPALGNILSSQGMPQMGSALGHLGGSRFGAAYNALSPSSSNGLGLGSLGGSANSDGEQPLLSQLLNRRLGGADLGKFTSKLAGSGMPSEVSEGSSGMGSGLLDYLLLGIAGAGALGGKTKYKVPRQYKNEPSLDEVINKLRNPVQEPERVGRMGPYVPPEKYFEEPYIGEEYEYPEFEVGKRYKNGGRVSLKIGGELKKGAKKASHAAKKAAKYGESTVRSVRRAATHAPSSILGAISPKKKELIPSTTGLSEEYSHPGLSNILYNQMGIDPTQKMIQDVMSEYGYEAPEKREIEYENPEVKSWHSPKELSSPYAPWDTSPENQQYRYENGLTRYSPYEAKHVLTNRPGQWPSYPTWPPPEKKYEPPKSMVEQMGPYRAPQKYFEEPYVGEEYQYPEFEEGKKYPEFKEGGYVDGSDGGQDDNVDADLPEGSYIVDATTVSLIGDGNSKAGAKKLDHLFEPHHHYSKGAHIIPTSDRIVPAKISQGEYEVKPHIVASIGGGDNRVGAKKIKNMIANIRKHKGVKKLPPKSKPLISYLK